MGEVAVFNAVRGMAEAEVEQRKNRQQNANDGSAELLVRWDRFLPRMVLRVLLVEADDSTRQIISALLRKCSYRVAAVSDGLKAWETLKRKAPDIDLILTEVEIPSISGFSLLTLIMEHEACKSIPVIMMSSHDSLSMVLKCMLKGAVDFLIKPVRRNELRNLWQHVWRRHAISRPPLNLTFPHNKLGVVSENNAASDNSRGSVGSTQKNTECSEKTSEAQSTCTSPFLEAESAYMENMQGKSQLKSSSNLHNIDTVKHEEFTKLERESAKHNDETREKSITYVSEAARCNKTFKSTDLRLEQGYDFTETGNQDEVSIAELSEANPNINTEIHGSSDELLEPSRGAIDLLATFENLPKNTDAGWSFKGGNTSKLQFDKQLELSLRRDFPGSSYKQATEERKTLNHSNASAFSWYSGSKLLQPLFPTPSITSAKLTNTDWNSHESHQLSGNTVDTSSQNCGTNQNHENLTTLVTGQSGQVEPKLPDSQLGLFPAIGVTSDHKSRGRGDVFHSMFFLQSGVHPIWTPKPVCQRESSLFPTSTSSQSNPESYKSEQCNHCLDDATYTSDQNITDKSNLDCARHGYPAAGQSAGTSPCHDAANHISNSAHGSIGSGSDGNATSAVVAKSNPESFSDSGCHSYDGFRGTDSHYNRQRDVALTKFRLKRKDRCYEKKVRYQSRKRLAEQRPRVKGQFVRQLHNDHPVADAGGGS